MNKTNIPYCDVTWNPITGCSNQFGCRERCWARRMAHRMAANPKVPHRERYKDFKPAFWPERLREPLRVTKPQVIAVSFMGDMFCEGVPYDWQEAVLTATLDTPHTYLFLTKRPDIMALVVNRFLAPALLPAMLKHCLFGTSISTQADANKRIPQLLKCPGRKWLSIEPMIQGISLSPWLMDGKTAWINDHNGRKPRTAYSIGWVVVGGESGPGARPMHPDWARSIRDQCQAAGVPFYMKQMARNEAIPADLMIRETHC